MVYAISYCLLKLMPEHYPKYFAIFAVAGGIACKFGDDVLKIAKRLTINREIFVKVGNISIRKLYGYG